MAKLTDAARTLIQKKTFAHVATLNPDGSPQVTPVWVDCDGDQILVNTAEGREKPRNLEQDPRVSISMLDPDDPYKHMLVQGELAEIEHEGADDHIDRLAKKYLGEDTYPFRQEGEVRIKLRFDAHKITING